MKLQSHETEPAGKWFTENNEMRRDPTCQRIEQLIVDNHLKQIAVSKQWRAWETLFQDPEDGRYWERTYPEGELQGGGPPRLQCISAEEAKQKYGDLVVIV
jgi:hypothetical protein